MGPKRKNHGRASHSSLPITCIWWPWTWPPMKWCANDWKKDDGTRTQGYIGICGFRGKVDVVIYIYIIYIYNNIYIYTHSIWDNLIFLSEHGVGPNTVEVFFRSIRNSIKRMMTTRWNGHPTLSSTHRSIRGWTWITISTYGVKTREQQLAKVLAGLSPFPPSYINWSRRGVRLKRHDAQVTVSWHLLIFLREYAWFTPVESKCHNFGGKNTQGGLSIWWFSPM